MRRTYIMALLASAGCITVPVTETLKPGQQEVSATFGGR